MKRIVLCGTLIAVVGLLAWAKAYGDALEHRFQTRAKVWDVYWNTGEQGVREATSMTYSRPMGMMYPGTLTAQYTTEFVEYWGARVWPWGGVDRPRSGCTSPRPACRA